MGTDKLFDTGRPGDPMLEPSSSGGWLIPVIFVLFLLGSVFSSGDGDTGCGRPMDEPYDQLYP